jgi:hypothetical protein
MIAVASTFTRLRAERIQGPPLVNICYFIVIIVNFPLHPPFG